jgi:hypothetical protein
MKNLNKYFKYFLICISIFVFILFLRKMSSYADITLMKRREIYLNHICYLNIHGIITKKLIDKTNHNFHLVYILMQNDTIKIAFDFDRSNFFEYCNINDSITKKIKTNEFILIRNQKKDTFYFDYKYPLRKIKL